MIRVKLNDVLDEARAHHTGEGTPKNYAEAERLYNEILNHNPGNPMVEYCLGSLFMETGRVGLATRLLSSVAQIDPNFGENWNNLGLTYRAMTQIERARECFDRAIPLLPQTGDINCNMAATYINMGAPEKALEYCNRALAIDPEHKKAKWHKSLALLELGRFDKAWDLHEVRLNDGAASANIATRNYHKDGMTQRWDGRSRKFVAIHGEQGLGDEIMFASCIADAELYASKIVIEPSPRLEGLFRRSFPDCHVYGTNDLDGRDWIPSFGVPDCKAALGSLPRFYRRSVGAFPGTPYLKPDPGLVEKYRERLRALGPKPKVGITWQGGVVQTRVDLRSIFPEQLRPLLELDADFVSLQYTSDASDNVAELKDKTGLVIHHWPDIAQAQNLDHPAALISALGFIVTVCQTAVHLAGAMGVQALCLTPSRPSWRYAVKTDHIPHDKMVWYESVKQRRMEGEEWGPTIEKVAREVKQRIETPAPTMHFNRPNGWAA